MPCGRARWRCARADHAADPESPGALGHVASQPCASRSTGSGSRSRSPCPRSWRCWSRCPRSTSRTRCAPGTRSSRAAPSRRATRGRSPSRAQPGRPAVAGAGAPGAGPAAGGWELLVVLRAILVSAATGILAATAMAGRSPRTAAILSLAAFALAAPALALRPQLFGIACSPCCGSSWPAGRGPAPTARRRGGGRSGRTSTASSCSGPCSSATRGWTSRRGQPARRLLRHPRRGDAGDAASTRSARGAWRTPRGSAATRRSPGR